MLPILKPNKNRLDEDSFRPISNLHSIEKILKEHIKVNLANCLEENNIILDKHHGSRKKINIQAAKAIIFATTAKEYKEERNLAFLSTDLSSTFDTVDHEIILRKREVHRMQEKELNFFREYLKDRTKYAEIDTKKS